MKLLPMFNINVNENINLKTNGADINLSLYEFSRWVCLIRGIDVIDSKAKQLSINLDTYTDWVKPLALQKYIDEETPGTVFMVKNLKDGIDVCIT